MAKRPGSRKVATQIFKVIVLLVAEAAIFTLWLTDVLSVGWAMGLMLILLPFWWFGMSPTIGIDRLLPRPDGKPVPSAEAIRAYRIEHGGTIANAINALDEQ
jgi:hypothetical protein